MQLAWMREYREVIEKLIKFANFYAGNIHKEALLGTDIPFSFSQIQVVEYLLENEDLNQNLTAIASRLGITYSTFSKIVERLSKKGLVEKYRIKGNKKNVVVKVTELGREIYQRYSLYVVEVFFGRMFAVADKIPREYLPLIARMLDELSYLQPDPFAPKDDTPVLIPVSHTPRKGN